MRDASRTRTFVLPKATALGDLEIKLMKAAYEELARLANLKAALRDMEEQRLSRMRLRDTAARERRN